MLDYNTNFKSPGQVTSLYAPDRFRTSDHDPVLSALNLGSGPMISGTPGPATVGAPYQSSLTVTGTAPVSLTVTSGALPPGVVLGPDGSLSGRRPTAAPSPSP